ncbi:hypothetical protein H6G76_22655 [Nostoc sp. FACHB-152]|uniref:hypothetical protein n=1 Tax=unclassified Nostoc TaxID=2593658 RepID=UPI0016896104|nr:MULTISPECIES: hypothetical protein [unclassified Nostoc]MBD2449914.1 hypothetical protein [Nostoc sp. FACHB-152]MBD2471374.1 hypothetical protein [Nostoc sp. FACHB-145]
MGNNILYWQKLGRVFVSFGKITEKYRSAIANLNLLTLNQPIFSAKTSKKFLPYQQILSQDKNFTQTLRNISLHKLRVNLRTPLRLKIYPSLPLKKKSPNLLTFNTTYTTLNTTS